MNIFKSINTWMMNNIRSFPFSRIVLGPFVANIYFAFDYMCVYSLSRMLLVFSFFFLSVFPAFSRNAIRFQEQLHIFREIFDHILKGIRRLFRSHAHRGENERFQFFILARFLVSMWARNFIPFSL